MPRRAFFNIKNGSWDWELLAAQNFVFHLAAYKTDRLRKIGGLREGFEGAQDYDLLLRYVTGANEKNLVHIPHVLYHWRAHENSTAYAIGAKGSALESQAKAAAEWLSKAAPGAVVTSSPNAEFRKFSYPLPAEKPLTSVIVEIPSPDFDICAHASSLAAKTACPLEVVYVCQTIHKEILRKKAASANLPVAITGIDSLGAPALNAGAFAARGQILGFMDARIIPETGDWLEELLACLNRPGIGAVEGATLDAERRNIHCGYMANGEGKLERLFALCDEKPGKWYNWHKLPRTVDALATFTNRENFTRLGGLNPAMESFAMQDYCLRLGGENLRSVWWPYVAFIFSGEEKYLKTRQNEEFKKLWQNSLVPFNPNIDIINGHIYLNSRLAEPEKIEAGQ